MTQQSFVRRRQDFWSKVEGIIHGGRAALKANASWFPRAFRELTQDLNTAKSHAFDPAIIERLNRLVLEGNQLLYGQRRWSLRFLADFIIRTFPCSVRSAWRGIAAAHLLFYGLIFFIALLCVRFPDMVYEILPYEQAFELEGMYDPESSHFLTPRDVSSDADMFGFYIYNNISIAFNTFAGGLLAGFGSFLILSFNAVFLGASAAHIINSGFSGTFFPFIIGHSSFELTAIVISAQAGFLMGYRFFVTRGLSRRASLREAGKAAFPLVMGSALLLVIAAFIEAFWSSRHELPLEIRFGAGIAGWILLLSYFLFAGRSRA
ncbi:stage II sporulation protein M [Treponema sp. OttesenSCG-928-L16]|nr:stage II sporulation protein M [Treponema sp. OttesenSCG-928-L16]